MLGVSTNEYSTFPGQFRYLNQSSGIIATVGCIFLAIALILAKKTARDEKTATAEKTPDLNTSEVLERKYNLTPFTVTEYKLNSELNRKKVSKMCQIWKQWTENNTNWKESKDPRKNDWISTVSNIQGMVDGYDTLLMLEKFDPNPNKIKANFHIYVSEKESIIEAISLVNHLGDHLHIDFLATNPKNIVKTTEAIKGAGKSIIDCLVQRCFNERKQYISVDAIPSSIIFYQKNRFSHLFNTPSNYMPQNGKRYVDAKEKNLLLKTDYSSIG